MIYLTFNFQLSDFKSYFLKLKNLILLKLLEHIEAFVLSIPLVLFLIVCFCVVFYGCQSERKRITELRLARALEQLENYTSNNLRYQSCHNLNETDNNNAIHTSLQNENLFVDSIKVIASSNITLFDHEKLPTYQEAAALNSNTTNKNIDNVKSVS